MRGLVLAIACLATPAGAQELRATDGTTELAISGPVDRYGHRIMGDVPEWSRLCLTRGGREACITLPEDRVFEDMEARLHDVDRDGLAEAVVVEAQANLGAALVIYDLEDGALRRVATPPIGTRFRWLAPVAVADLDGDSRIELAYVDRPHLAQTLRVWRYDGGRLTELARLTGVTNHRIGEPYIVSALRACAGSEPEMILTDGARRDLLAVRFNGNALTARVVGRYRNRDSISAAARC
ncbi:MAG: VCBS repeat-containing protein [Pseudomonadota bacterium]